MKIRSKINHRYYLCLIICVAVVLTVVETFLFPQADRDIEQLSYYQSNSYRFVFETASQVYQNDYLKCSSVGFYQDSNLSKSLLGSSYMVLQDSVYDSQSPFALQRVLGEREVVLSKSLAQQYHLSKGSHIYSKHIINNQIEEYTVVGIIQSCYGVTDPDFDLNMGVILMGTDIGYQANTDFPYIGFSKDDPSQLIKNKGVPLISLSSKSNCQERLLKKWMANQVVICVLISAILVVYLIIQMKVQHVFYSKRILMGCSLNAIRYSLFNEFLLPGIISLLVSGALCVISSSLYNKGFSFGTGLLSFLWGTFVLIIISFVAARKER